MISPTFSHLNTLNIHEPAVYFASGSPSLSGNPRFHKHTWQVFSPYSEWEGDAFFEHAPRLCIHDFEVEVARLLAAGVSCLAYGRRRPRKDPRNPFDMSHPKWKNVQFAPSWDDDTDPVVEGVFK